MVRRMLAVGLVMAWVVAVVPAARASVGAQPRSSVTFDGHVQVAATSGTTVYVGGEFTHATDLGGKSSAAAGWPRWTHGPAPC